ncbi:hypothetical protein BKA67DRAFT_223395 [Truncatella angustata]|uniref:Endosomal spry domain-containing protein n=1 Tax=Truncatella angustata TaxID=152316 RepID=A0A9P8ZYC4_9PEZI|nr:uncharacterized protein BKA67DRAFT_223395 [Truncatella angustata]KAH6655012.1 hypothetical protein BKA67DRAFT_223395 [Truncatella angustata]KAH8204102.1 hypothetical protein TruAng_001784 [Truncatella angustata]
MAPLLPTLAAGARTLLSRAIVSNPDGEQLQQRSPATPSINQLGPLAARSLLVARDDTTSDIDPSRGSIDPHNINNNAMFALFALIGVAFVVTGIWFFFWAKNGGFQFRENDWDDYKSTVLRRTGPNGTILSNATKSTKLGGGSVYKDIDDGRTEYTGGLTMSHLSGDTSSTLSGITAGPSDIGAREKREAKKRRKVQEKEKRDREKEKKKQRKDRSGRKVGEDGALIDEEAELEAKEAMRHYRHEKPARVGGLNKESEGSQWDGSTNPSNSTVGSDSLLSGRQSTPTNTPDKKKGGIRKVYSVADRNAAQEQERIRAEARRLQAKGRQAASSRRDFSFRHGDSIVEEGVNRSDISSSTLPLIQDNEESDLGTKSYTHHIPGLSSSQAGGTDVVDYAEERRKRRGAGSRGAGYRRER